MSHAPPPPDRCPACGDDNECGMVVGRSVCWCFKVTVPRELIERLNREVPGGGCVCPQCATGRPSPKQVKARIESMKRWRSGSS